MHIGVVALNDVVNILLALNGNELPRTALRAVKIAAIAEVVLAVTILEVRVDMELVFGSLGFGCLKGHLNTKEAQSCVRTPVGTTAEELLLANVVDVEVASGNGLAGEDVLAGLSGIAATVVAQLLQCVGNGVAGSSGIELLLGFRYIDTLSHSKGLGGIEVVDIGLGTFHHVDKILKRGDGLEQ